MSDLRAPAIKKERLSERRLQTAANKLTRRLVDIMVCDQPAFLKECEFRPVKNSAEFKVCSHLVYLEYLKKQYAIPNKNGLRLSIHQLIQHSTTMIVVFKNKYILGTITAVEDSPLGLPMDSLFKEELNGLRKKGRHIFEATMLAMNDHILNYPGVPNNVRLAVLLHLFKATFKHIRENTVMDTCAACFHPRHELFYQAMQFKQMGELKNYSSVQGNPALAYNMDLNCTGDSTFTKMKDFFGLSGPKPITQNLAPALKFQLQDMGTMFVEAKTQVTGNSSKVVLDQK